MILPEKGYKRIAVIVLYAFITFVISAVFIKYLLSCFLPFIIAFIFAQATRKTVLFLGNKLHFKRTFSVFIITVIFFSTIFLSAYFLISTAVSELSGHGTLLSNENITALFSKPANVIITFIHKNFPQLSYEVSGIISDIASDIDSMITTVLEAILPHIGEALVNVFSALPKIFLFTGVMIIAIFYFSCDYEKIISFIKLQLSEKQAIFIRELKTQFFSTVVSIIKAYAILMGFTFIQLLTGFIVAGIDYPLLLALFISLIDILPVLGTGTVLIPWCIILFLSGNVKTGLCILILYVIITLTRQIAEPKVLGNSVGLHPLVTLVSMYFGLKLIGIKGLFLFPLTMIIIKNLNDKGFIRLYINPDYNNKHKKTKEKNS